MGTRVQSVAPTISWIPLWFRNCFEFLVVYFLMECNIFLQYDASARYTGLTMHEAKLQKNLLKLWENTQCNKTVNEIVIGLELMSMKFFSIASFLFAPDIPQIPFKSAITYSFLWQNLSINSSSVLYKWFI